MTVQRRVFLVPGSCYDIYATLAYQLLAKLKETMYDIHGDNYCFHCLFSELSVKINIE